MAGRKYDPLPLLHISLPLLPPPHPPVPCYSTEIMFYAFDLPSHSRDILIFRCSATIHCFRGMEVETPSQAGVSMVLILHFFLTRLVGICLSRVIVR